MSGTTHIVGLGVAGLSAAVRLAERGLPVTLYDGAKVAGGRCRSFHDARLDCAIDNGNHLLLSGNRSALSYLDLLGARDELEIQPDARFDFVDLESGERWQVALNRGALPLWLLDREKSIPGVRLRDYASALRFPFASQTATIDGLSKSRTSTRTNGKDMLYQRFWEPMSWAVLNTTPDRASARLMWAVLRETFARGGAACRPMIARRGLSETFVDPALAYLAARKIQPFFNEPLKEIGIEGDRITRLDFAERSVLITPADRVILALPRAQMAKLMPEISVPDGDAAIVNAHFRMQEPLTGAQAVPLLGLVNARTHWIFTRGAIISLTISAADALGLDRLPEEEFLPLLWDEVKVALRLPAEASYAAARLIRERRATFDQSPASVAKRPKTRTAFENLYLAGDWTDTGLPATIEGAIRSGAMAAKAISK
ncbi:MAG: FAD-dependent oxidoreductase [Rhizobiales bacterium]|nr:FAD-dependent oxidoreductase [Hyphomicrobiales bacterium]